MQTAIYVRISQDRSGEGLGVGRQLEDCRALAESLGWEIGEVYRDNDTSATKRDKNNRPVPRKEYQRLLADIGAGRWGAVVAWHPDRFYRQLADLEELIWVVERHDVEIRTVRYGDFDLATPTGRMIARILGSVATGETEVKTDRWKRAWRQKRLAGLPIGGQRLYGYSTGSKIVEDEAAVIQRLASAVLAGAGLQTLANDLNRRDIPTASGHKWNGTRIRRVLMNPRIAGHATLKGEIVGKGNWEPILDESTWRTVRAMLAARSRTAALRVSVLAGLVYCGRCNQPMLSGRRTDGTRRLRCLKTPRRDGCGSTCPAAPVEEIAEELAKKLLISPELRRWTARARAGGQEHIVTEIDAMQLRLEEIKQVMASGSKNVDLLDEAADIVREKIADLESQLSASAPIDIPEDPDVDWPTDLGARRRLIDLVVERVWVDPAKTRGGRFDPLRVRVDPTPAVRRA